MDLILL